MLTFEQFLLNTAEKGGSLNTLFEERLFALVGTLEKIAGALAAEKIPYEVRGWRDPGARSCRHETLDLPGYRPRSCPRYGLCRTHYSEI